MFHYWGEVYNGSVTPEQKKSLLLQCEILEKLVTFRVYSLSFNLADLNWLDEQSISVGRTHN